MLFNGEAVDAPTLGRELKKLRLEAGVSITDLGNALKASKSHISLIENGRALPTLTTLSRYSKVLGYRWKLVLEKKEA